MSSSHIRIPVNRFADANLRDALIKLETGVNAANARLSGILVHSQNQAAPPTIPSTVVSDTLYTMAPANVSTTAASVGTALTASPGDHVHYLPPGVIDAGTLDGMDSTEFVWTNGLNPLTNAWDAGNFAITLGSIVGKSSDLAITAASGGAMTFSASKASGTTPFSFTDTIARTTGPYFTINDNLGTVIGSWNANGPLFALNIPGGVSAHTAIMAFAGTTTGTASSYAVNLTLTNTGTTSTTGQLQALKAHVVSSGTSTAFGYRQLRGLRAAASVASGSDFGLRANDTIGNVLGVGFFNTGNTWPDAALLVLHHNNVNPGTVTRFLGLGISRKPAGMTATNESGIHCMGNMQMEAGDRLVFDGTATFTNAILGGGTTADGRCTALTAGDTYLAYNSGSTQLDLFVDAAQAFHFDAGGAAGTSRCYGNMLISGTGQVGGLLTADVAISVSTGNVLTLAGDIVATGDVIASSDIALSGVLYFDGFGGNDTMQYAAGLIRTTIGGTAIGDWYSGGLDIASGKQFSIAATRLVLSETGLTHDPASSGTFTVTLDDALLIQSNGTATTRTVCDIFRNSASGTRTILDVRDTGGSYFTVVSNGVVNAYKDVKLNTAGNGFYVKEGTDATMGSAVLVAGTVTVNTTKVTANSRIFLTVQVLGGIAAPVGVAVTARTAATSFTITSASALDTSTIGWLIMEPA